MKHDCEKKIYNDKEKSEVPNNQVSDRKTVGEVSERVKDTKNDLEPAVSVSQAFHQDISLWQKSTKGNVDYWVKDGSSKIQYCDYSIIESKSSIQTVEKISRKCNLSMFERKLENGDVLK